MGGGYLGKVGVFVDTYKLFVIQGGTGGQRVGKASFPGLYHRLKTKRRIRHKNDETRTKQIKPGEVKIHRKRVKLPAPYIAFQAL